MEPSSCENTPWGRITHCAMLLGYSLLCNASSLFALVYLSQLAWTRLDETNDVPVLDPMLTLNAIVVLVTVSWSIMTWANVHQSTFCAGCGPKYARLSAVIGVVLTTAFNLALYALVTYGRVDLRYYGADLLLLVLFFAAFIVLDSKGRRAWFRRNNGSSESKDLSEEVQTTKVGTGQRTKQTESSRQLLVQLLPMVSAITVSFLYPFLIIPIFFSGSVATRLLVALVLHPVLLVSAEAFGRSSRSSTTIKRLREGTLTIQEAEWDAVDESISTFPLKMGSPTATLAALVGAAVTEAFERGFVVEIDTAIRRWQGKPELLGDELRLQRLVWMCDSNHSAIAELIAIVGASLAQIILEPHAIVLALGYAPNASLDLAVVFVQLLVELTLEVGVDNIAMWAEMDHEVPVTQYFRRVRDPFVLVFHTAATVLGLTMSAYSFIRTPYVFGCGTNSACACVEKQPGLFEEWYGDACNSTIAQPNVTATRGEENGDMFENVDPLALLVTILTGLAILALISLSVLFARYRKRNVLVTSLDENAKREKKIRIKAERERDEAKDFNRALKNKLDEAQIQVQDALGRSTELLKPFAIKHSELSFEAELGKGAFGIVWKGRFRDDDVAIKTIRITKVSDFVIKDFMHELTIMVPLKHKNLVNLVGGCWNDGPDKLCIVLEFCSRGSLRNLLTATKEYCLEHDWSHPFFGIACGIASCFRYFHHSHFERQHASLTGHSHFLLVPVPLTYEDRKRDLARHPSMEDPSKTRYYRHPAISRTMAGYKWSASSDNPLPPPFASTLHGPTWSSTAKAVDRIFRSSLITPDDPYSIQGMLNAGMIPVPCCICCQYALVRQRNKDNPNPVAAKADEVESEWGQLLDELSSSLLEVEVSLASKAIPISDKQDRLVVVGLAFRAPTPGSAAAVLQRLDSLGATSRSAGAAAPLPALMERRAAPAFPVACLESSTTGVAHALKFTGGKFTIGRAPSCSITVSDDRRISGVHCVLKEGPAPGSVVAMDASTNGTWVGEEKLKHGVPTPLLDGATLTLAGGCTYVFHEASGGGGARKSSVISLDAVTGLLGGEQGDDDTGVVAGFQGFTRTHRGNTATAPPDESSGAVPGTWSAPLVQRRIEQPPKKELSLIME